MSNSDKPDLVASLTQLPIDASELIVYTNFVTAFLQYLGFNPSTDIAHKFSTGQGAKKVDCAARKSAPRDLPFNKALSHPEIIVEVKKRSLNLADGSIDYQSTVQQIKEYLLEPNCQSVKWGIITNADHLQIFRKHGKVIHPVTPCLAITPSNIIEIAEQVEKFIDSYHKALTIAVYNNKGGVGKTTITLNLASVLSLNNKKVLIVDFDPLQRDLTRSLELNIKSGKSRLYDVIKDRNIQISSVIDEYVTDVIIGGKKIPKRFDIICGDERLQEETYQSSDLTSVFNAKMLDGLLTSVKKDYDYIIIDTSPNWNIFSKSAVYAADVVLLPAKHNNVYSLENAAIAISKFIPEVQKERQKHREYSDFGPIALPVFFNEAKKMTDSQRDEIQKKIQQIITDTQRENGINLSHYFFPKDRKGAVNLDIFHLPEYEVIAKGARLKKPAAFAHKTVCGYYYGLAKEYFLQ